MVKVGLIGFGKWGKILRPKLEKLCDLRFICRSKDDYKTKLKNVDWVIIATPDETHYEIVKECIISSKDIFCEKPLTPTYEQSKELFDLADEYNVKLYVDDVQNFRVVDYKLKPDNFIERKKNSKNNEPRDLFYKLAYHDFYFLYEYIKDKKIKDIKVLNTIKNLNFKVLYDDFSIEFLYDVNYEGNREHNLNGISLMGDGTDDPLSNMLENVLNGNVNFDYNKKISLFANEFIDLLDERIFKKPID